MNISILFVCLGNICRSPAAEGIFRKMVDEEKLAIDIDSAGTGGWHTGKPPDPRMQKTALARGYNLSTLRARQINRQDCQNFDYIIAMDKDNLREIKRLCPNSKAEIKLFLDYAPSSKTEVPDPYYGGREGFNIVIDLIEDASAGLLAKIKEQLA